jgi:hypothetical protein
LPTEPCSVTFRLCPEQESNLQSLGFKPSRSAVGVPGRAVQMIPDGLEPSLPGCRPGVVATGPRDRGRRSAEGGERRARGNHRYLFLALRPPRSALRIPMTEVGVEPTGHSPVSQTGRFPCLRTRSKKLRVQDSHLACCGYEPLLGPRPPAISQLQAPVSNRANRPYESQLGTCRACRSRDQMSEVRLLIADL